VSENQGHSETYQQTSLDPSRLKTAQKTVDSQLEGPVAPNPPPLRFVHEGSEALVVVDDVGVVAVLDMSAALSSNVFEGSRNAK
jgi:hypothetical protein